MAKEQLGSVLLHIRKLVGTRAAAGLSDRQLLEYFAVNHDEAAFAELVQRHGRLVLSVCHHVLHHEQDAEDAFQVTFLVLARKAASIRKGDSLASWLYGVAYRTAMRAKAEAAKRRDRERRANPSPHPDPSNEAARRELQSLLHDEVNRLPAKYRAPFVLCCLEGRSRTAAAQKLGWKEGTLSGRLAQAREWLQRRLLRRGVVLSAASLAAGLAEGEASAAVPAGLVQTTIKGATMFAAGQTASGVISAQVATLAEGVLKAMFLTKFKIATAVLLAVGLAASGAGALAYQVLAAKQSPAPHADALGAVAKVEDPAKPEGEKQARTDLYGDPLPAGATARLGTIRFRQEGFGQEWLAFSPDGKALVTAGEGHWIRFWEPSTGRLLRELSPGTLWIRGFALSPNGKEFAVAGFLPDQGNLPALGAIRILDTSSGRETRTFSRDATEVGYGALAFTPDGKLLASIAGNGVLRIEEVSSGVEILRQQFPGDILANLAMSPDGSTLAVASGPNTRKLYIWKWQAGEEPRELKIGDHPVTNLCFSPDNSMLAASSDRGVGIRVWDVGSARQLYQLESPGPEDYRSANVAFFPDRKGLAVAGHRRDWGGAIHLWDPATGQYMRRMEVDSPLGMLAISADSRLIAAGTGSGVRVWDLRSGKELAANDESHRSQVGRVAVSAQGLVATASDDHTVRLWDATTGKQRLKLTHGHWARAIALSPDGAQLASSSLDDTVRLWDTATGREIYKLPGHGKSGGYRSLRFMPEGKRLLSWGDDFYLRMWAVGTGKALLEHAIRPSGIHVPGEDAEPAERKFMMTNGEATFSPDGKAFVLNIGRDFYVFDVATGKELRKIPSDGGHVISLAISPDSKLLLASAWSKGVQRKLADGRTHFSAANDHPISLWDLASGERIQQIILPEGGAGPVAFSSDGKVFATGTDKPRGKIRLWEVATGKERLTIEGFRGTARSLAFSPDGKRLVSGMQDTTALVWDLTQYR